MNNLITNLINIHYLNEMKNRANIIITFYFSFFRKTLWYQISINLSARQRMTKLDDAEGHIRP